MNNWVENSSIKPGDTVMVNLSLPNETIIGIVDRFHDGRVIINIANRFIYVKRGATFYTYNK